MQKITEFFKPLWTKFAVVILLTGITFASFSQTFLHFNKDSKAAAQTGTYLEVTMTYNASGSPVLQIGQATKLSGYTQGSSIQRNKYRLVAVNILSTVLFTAGIDIPQEASVTQTRTNTKIQTIKFSVNIPYNTSVKRVQVVDNNNKVISYLSSTSFKTENLMTAASAYTGEKYLDVALISQGYTTATLSKFQSDALRMKNKFLATEPFKSRSNQIKFFFINNTTDLGCTSNSALSYFCSDISVVNGAVNRAGYSYADIVAVVVNNDTNLGGVTYMPTRYLISYSGADAGGVLVHESAHVLGALDEYTYTENSDFYPLDPYDFHYNRNCDYPMSDPSNSSHRWFVQVARTDYSKGCTYSNWGRASDRSIMNNPENSEANFYFNTVTLNLINAALNSIAGSYSSGSTVPQLTVKSPLSGTTVVNPVSFNFGFSSITAVHRVEFYVNNILSNTVYRSPVNDLTSTKVILNPFPVGTNTITIKVWDAIGRLGSTSTIRLNNSQASPTTTKAITSTTISASTTTKSTTTTKAPTTTTTNPPIMPPTIQLIGPESYSYAYPGSVILSAKASNPGSSVEMAFRLVKGENCETIYNSAGPWDGFQSTSATHTYTFNNLAAGKYYWSAKGQNDWFVYSSGDNFCGTPGWAPPRVLYVSPMKIELQTPGGFQAAIPPNLMARAYGNTNKTIQMAFRVVKNDDCTTAQTSTGPWSNLASSGSYFNYTFLELTSGANYKWAVKTRDEAGLYSAGENFCGSDGWSPTRNFSLW